MESVIFDTTGIITTGEKKQIEEAVRQLTKEPDDPKIVLGAYLILLAKGGSSGNANGNLGFNTPKNRYVLADLRRVIRIMNDTATLRQVSRGFADDTKHLLETNKIVPALSIKAKLDKDEMYWGFDGATYSLNCPDSVSKKLEEYLETVKARKK
jgi:hypothetical protein